MDRITVKRVASGICSLLCLLMFFPLISGHASIWHPSMYGFNVTIKDFPYDNRPVAPLYNMTFKQWWFHNHLDYPPHPSDVYHLRPGQPAVLEIACNKQSTSYWATSGYGDNQHGDDPCPGFPSRQYHTQNIQDTKGCALAIAYKSNVRDVQPEELAVFSVNHTCVWHRFTEFQVPERMPPCPVGGCQCAFLWIHSPDSGNEQMYMNGFRCDVALPTSMVSVAKSKVARRCGADPANGKPHADPSNCTYGAKQPLYWLQAERDNMFEGYYSPPFYNDLYNFKDGAQNDIFEDSYSKDGTIPRDMTLEPVVGTESDEGLPTRPAVPLSEDPQNATSGTTNANAEVWAVHPLRILFAVVAVIMTVGMW